MLRAGMAALVLGYLLTALGCMSSGPACCGACTPKKGPKTLLEWAICKEEEPDDSAAKNGDDKKEGAADKDGGNGNKNGQEKKKDGDNNGEEEEDEIETDRPDFTEASTTVGKGRIQLESGYTYFRSHLNGTRTNSHSYPEALFRIGMFAEWFELRIGQNFGSERETTPDGVTERASGAFDLYLGTKLALTEQQKWLPEAAVILQMTVPSGCQAFTAGEVLPGVNLLYGWDVVKDCLAIGGSTQANRAIGSQPDPDAFPQELGVTAEHPYLVLAQSVTVNYTLTKKLAAYTEWFAFFPSSSLDPDVAAEHYFDGGFTYKIRPNLQYDIRAGVGLNKHADDFFAGTGLSMRY